MQVNINTIQTAMKIPECMMIHELQQAMSQDNHLKQLKEQIIRRWSEDKDHITPNLRPYWMLWDNMAVIYEVILKGRHVVIPKKLQKSKH